MPPYGKTAMGTYGDVLHIARDLDRTDQWRHVLDECQGDHHCIFLLRGDSSQALGLFVDRIRHFLAAKGPKSRVFEVSLRHGDEDAECAADWLRRLADGLAPGKQGRAAQHLAQAASELRPFLILGQQPLHQERLSVEARKGLRDFLEDGFPQCLVEAAPAQPVALLVAVEDEVGDTLVGEIEKSGERAASRFNRGASKRPAVSAEPRGFWSRWFGARLVPQIQSAAPRLLHFVPLKAVGFPSWEEVELYLKRRHPPPAAEVVDRIRQAHRAIEDSGSSFLELSERLHRWVGPI